MTVASYISSRDTKKLIGIKLLNIIAGNTNKFSGDGTTTSTVLAGQLIKRGNYLINSGYDSTSVSDGVLFAKEIIMKILEKIRVGVTTKKQLFDLAMISTAKDEKISEIVSEAINISGKHGEILIEEGYYENSVLIKTKAFTLNHGAASIDFLEQLDQ